MVRSLQCATFAAEASERLPATTWAAILLRKAFRVSNSPLVLRRCAHTSPGGSLGVIRDRYGTEIPSLAARAVFVILRLARAARSRLVMCMAGDCDTGDVGVLVACRGVARSMVLFAQVPDRQRLVVIVVVALDVGILADLAGRSDELAALLVDAGVGASAGLPALLLGWPVGLAPGPHVGGVAGGTVALSWSARIPARAHRRGPCFREVAIVPQEQFSNTLVTTSAAKFLSSEATWGRPRRRRRPECVPVCPPAAPPSQS